MAFDRIARGTALLALLAVTALVVPATKAADPPTPRALRSYAIPGHGVLELDVPATWKSSLDQPPDGQHPTMTFRPATTQEFELKVTATWDSTGRADAPSPAAIRSGVQHTGERLLPTAVEKTLWSSHSPARPRAAITTPSVTSAPSVSRPPRTTIRTSLKA